ncbi:MAG: hypothetical protein HYX78_02180, partial [Armatimonadetes bacterium]|nr:hypothetical protein [Armatimonadota bacterium]
VNMISVSMQGGCGCENMPNLRIDTNNVELGALMAPRPMIMIAATGDWTKDTPKAEYPATRHIYSLFGATDKVTSVQMDAGHNYNKDSREAVYSWFARHLPKKPSSKPVKEQPFEVEKPEDLRVFPDDKRPEGALDKDGIVNMLIERSKAQLEECRPVDRGILNRLRKSYEPALRHALALYAKPSVQVDLRGEEDRGGYKLTRLVIKDVSRGAQIPALLFIPNNEQGNAVLMVNRAGKLACLDRSGENPGALASYLIDKGCSVLAIDCFGIGENGAPEGARRLEPKLKFFETFNRADTAERVYDILVALEYLASGPGSKSTHLVGIGEAGLWSLLARPFSSRVSRTIVDAVGFDTSNDESYLKQLYVPCLRRAGDLSTAMALSAPGDLLIHNTQGTFDASWAKDAYAAAGKSDRLRVLEGKTSDIELARWLAIEN